MNKKVLIVSYTFPPSTNVGGRRWSKLSAHLAKKGNNIHIITATPDINGEYGTSTSDNITIHRVKSNYPKILTHYNSKSFFEKLSYVLAARFLFYTNKGNIYDKSVRWRKALQAKIVEITEQEKITNVIVSAPPFQHLYYVAALKDKYPHLNIVLDFRDPWAEHHEFSSFYSLSAKRMKHQLHIEKLALEKADRVVSVSQGITDALVRLMGTDNKFSTITNGIDSADYKFLEQSPAGKQDDVRIVYYGSLYPRTEDTIEALVQFINKNRDALIKARVKFEFCGHVNEESLAILKKADKNIFVHHGVKPLNEALTILSQASAGLIIIAKGHEDIQFNTKLLECMALHKKILLIGPGGIVSQFLTRNNIGVQFTNETIEGMLPWIVSKEKLHTLSYKNFDISLFEYANLARQVEELLK